MNKRVSKRYEQTASVTFCCFNYPNQFSGELINYSKSGLCFDTDEPIREKTIVQVILRPESWEATDPEILEGLRTISVAEVKWCHEFANDENSHYEIGVRYP